MEQSRTTNTIKNFTSGAIVQIINKLLAFVIRTVFIKMLSEEYLGINGLFTNVLTILSFAELGFGTTIIYNMYKPVTEKDTEKIKSLMQLYKRVYQIIGFAIAVIGICLIPFLQYIMTDVPDIPENITYIYLLFLINTVLSYFFSYKKSIITAHQQESIINKYSSIVYVVQTILQVLFLFTTRNYIVFLLIQILCTLIGNLLISIKADKMFPYLKEKNIEKISKEEKGNIFKNVKAMVVYKFGQTILNGTDSIIISSMFSVATVGLYSNYMLIINSITMILESALNSITGSVGNLNATSDTEREENVFYQLFFISFVIYNFCSIAIMILIDPFINLWIGDYYLITYSAVIALGFSMFVNGIRFAAYTYRTTLGLFQKGKIAPLLSAIINIILSIILGKLIGLAGIFLATAISRILTTTWIDPYLIHKYEFKSPLSKFFKKYIIYLFIFTIGFILSYVISNLLTVDNNLLDFLIKIGIVCIIPNVIALLFTFKTKEYKGLMQRIEFLRSKKVIER